MRMTASLSAMLLAVAVTACLKINPAFDELDELGDETEGPGDGDPGDGDGEPGDGDGSPTGDGDGSPTGDGDGSPTGDGDGEPTGDGDGDGDANTCEQVIPDFPYPPAFMSGPIEIDVASAPGFAEQDGDCYTVYVCASNDMLCGPGSPYFSKLSSGGQTWINSIPPLSALQIRFIPGPAECLLADPLVFDTSQFVTLSGMMNNVETLLDVRLPCHEGEELRLYVADDGSTFADKGLTMPAALW